MKAFMDKDFLLQTETAKRLFHKFASAMPIIDYHCHLDPKMIADDYQFKSITELWLGGDHYKWRALRSNGVEEKYITGEASDWEKFKKWSETIPYCMRNPLYHWTHLELRTAFDIDLIFNPKNARVIYEACNAKLKEPAFSAQGLMKRYNVEVVCTTDDPIDSLEYHQQIREKGTCTTKVLPAWRPDKAMAVENPILYKEYIEKLGEAASINISTYTDLLDALQNRHTFFASMGCKLSDHGLDRFYAEDYTEKEIAAIFNKVMAGQVLTDLEIAKYKSALLIVFGEMDADAGWVQQFHYGVIRNNNTKMFNLIGADTGFDSIGEFNVAKDMATYFDKLNSRNKLAKTIIYNLNPVANEMISTMIGNFQEGSTPGKMQFGSAWWFGDQLGGMEKQMNALSLAGLLSRFVGMLTDSRSFISYPRHEYFRRTLCNLLGQDVENGLIPNSEIERLEKMVEDICYNNAKNYFKF